MKSFGLMVVGLSFLFCGCDRGLKHGVEFVMVVGTNEVSQISSNEIQGVVKTLANRVDKLGYPSEVNAMGSNRVRVKLRFEAVEQMGKRRTLFTQRGLLEFRLVHEDTARLVQEGLVPAGYILMKEMQVMQGGGKQFLPYIVSRQGVAGLSGTNISNAQVVRGRGNDPQVAFQLDDAGRAAFAKVTGENVGRQLAIVMDGEIYSAATIRSPITEGKGVISGGSMTDQEVWELVVLIQFPLHTPVKIVEERTF